MTVMTVIRCQEEIEEMARELRASCKMEEPTAMPSLKRAKLSFKPWGSRTSSRVSVRAISDLGAESHGVGASRSLPSALKV